jgi:hypothetical protein
MNMHFNRKVMLAYSCCLFISNELFTMDKGYLPTPRHSAIVHSEQAIEGYDNIPTSKKGYDTLPTLHQQLPAHQPQARYENRLSQRIVSPMITYYIKNDTDHRIWLTIKNNDTDHRNETVYFDGNINPHAIISVRHPKEQLRITLLHAGRLRGTLPTIPDAILGKVLFDPELLPSHDRLLRLYYSPEGELIMKVE